MKKLIIIAILLIGGRLFSQDSNFEIKVSNDTVLLGNYVIVKFVATDIEGEFIKPYLDNFEIVSGPNVSTMMSIINGESTGKSTHTYYLKPKETGEIFIDEAMYESEGNTYKTEPYKLIVLPNPDNKIVKPKGFEDESFNIFQQDDNFDFFRDRRGRSDINKPKKKKYKTKKI